jgi:DNA-binding transcriptional regulator YdaS (Cro superfamily)
LRDPKAKVPIKHAINIEILTKGAVKARSLRSDVMKNYELVAR